MELLCIEIESEPRGYLDPVFLDDERVLRNLLLTEERYTISSSYFKCFQTELQTHMRKIVCSWMLEVGSEVALFTFITCCSQTVCLARLCVHFCLRCLMLLLLR